MSVKVKNNTLYNISGVILIFIWMFRAGKNLLLFTFILIFQPLMYLNSFYSSW